MSRRNQPYLPLYVQDFLTDEKLIECSASATGIYARLLCIMHKSDPYGTILLKQKDKQTESTCLNFASKLSKQMPYKIEEIEAGLNELISEGVLVLEEDKIYQKRMIRDNYISLKRSEAGKRGGEKTQFAKAKFEASAEAKFEASAESLLPRARDIKCISIINKKEERKIKSSKYMGEKVFGENWDQINITYGEFKKMRTRIKKPMTELAEKRVIEKLKKISSDNIQLAINVLEQSIVKCWSDLYPLKEESGKIKAEMNPRTYG